MQDLQQVILDTNVLLDGINLSQFSNVFLPITVVEELDKIKHKSDGELNYKARNAIKQIKKATNIEYKLDYSYSLPIWLDESVPDNRILGFAMEIYMLNKDVKLISNDVNMLVKAKALCLPCESLNELNNDNKEIYTGYKKLSGDTNFINNLFTDIENGINTYNFLINEYLILYNTDLQNSSEYRFNGEKFVDLRLPTTKVIKAHNSVQRCALDLLNNKDIPIKIIAGGFGTGKTISAVKVGLNQVIDKELYETLVYIRNPIPVDGTDIGFLPGTKSEKIYEYCRPFLQYIQSNKDQFYAENLIKNDRIKMDAVSFLKGVSIEDSYVIMDEAEDLNLKLIKTIGSRIGNKSCIVFTGDWEQSEKKYKYDNGLLKLIQQKKGDPLMGVVVLDEVLRSPVSKLFNDLN